MKYVISVDEKKTWIHDGVTFSYAFVKTSKDEGNKEWLEAKNNCFFDCISAHKAEAIKAIDLFVYSKDQSSYPLFIATDASDDIGRLMLQAYGSDYYEHHLIVLPDISLENMELQRLGEIDPYAYKRNTSYDDDFDFSKIEIVREKTLGCKFYRTENYVRYDECLTNREDVCEVRLHPYCSDFNLVKDIELAFYDYDM